MTISFRINAASEAVFTPAALKALREAPTVMALDWLRDIQAEAEELYNELHANLWRKAGQ